MLPVVWVELIAKFAKVKGSHFRPFDKLVKDMVNKAGAIFVVMSGTAFLAYAAYLKFWFRYHRETMMAVTAVFLKKAKDPERSIAATPTDLAAEEIAG
jgi:hypothetical protein